MTVEKAHSFQELIINLEHFWKSQGCALMQPWDLEVGAGTFHPATLLRSLGPEPWRSAYVQSCRRPTDGRYGNNPNRAQMYFQFQVVLKPSPHNIQDLFLASLSALGIDIKVNDVRFVEDNWTAPTLGAWGTGWEVWCNGMEISQFTYFQQAGGLTCQPVTGELTYGLERIAMYIQGVDSLFDLVWSLPEKGAPLTYGDLFLVNEQQMSAYNFEYADVSFLKFSFEHHEKMSKQLLTAGLVLPAYEQVAKASHTFNLLDARHAISVTERQGLILRIRKLANWVAESYLKQREELGFPLLKDGKDAK